MDKFEYKVRADEIKDLIARGDYAQAAEIADTIDWRRVKSVMMLCTISDLYKINRRFEDAKDILLLAYDRRPGGRTICYSLCELCIKTEEYVQAVNYYKEFVQVASKDPGRYILQYKLFEAQDVSLEERISVLEELKKRDYREKWAYELAYLYHRVGLGTRCVEECDELILWFGEGKYVIKAMELKMLHQPLSPSQQEKYDHRFDAQKKAEEEARAAAEAAAQKQAMRVVMPEAKEQTVTDATVVIGQEEKVQTQPQEVSKAQAVEQESSGATEASEEEIQVKTVDVGKYNTINLQAELAAGLQEVLGVGKAVPTAEPEIDTDTESLDYPELSEVDENDLEPDAGEIEATEVFFGATGEIGQRENALTGDTSDLTELTFSEESETKTQKEEKETEAVEKAATETDAQSDSDETAAQVMEQMRLENMGENAEQVRNAEPPKALAGVLSQESDGQLRIVIPERETIEKQITGQMNIEDILAEWERMKKEREEKHKEEVRQHVLQQTGAMFTEFEAAVRDGLLEQLEKEAAQAAKAAKKASPVQEAEHLSNEVPTEQMIEPEVSAEPEMPTETEASAEAEAVTEVEPPVEVEVVAEPEVMTEVDAVTEPETDIESDAFTEPETDIESDAFTEPETDAESEEVTEAEMPVMSEVQAESVEEYAEPVQSRSEQQEAKEVSEEKTAVEENDSEEEKATEEPDAVLTEEPVQEQVRRLTREERELYAPFIQSKSAKKQLAKAIDAISLAAYTGNVIITGQDSKDNLKLAKRMIRQLQMTDSNFSGKVAKISGSTLNQKDISEILSQLNNGALIIQKVSAMEYKAADTLYDLLQRENFGIVVIMEDSKKSMKQFLLTNPKLYGCFNARMDIEALSNDTLVAFGKRYAREREFSIDEMGVLALHTRIDQLQTSEHSVTVMEVKEIVDEAIRSASRKTVRHFVDILLAKRYDDEDMIILTEKDFAR